MKTILTAAVFGAMLATALFFIPFLIPLLIVLFVIRLLARLAFGRRWGGSMGRRNWAGQRLAWAEQTRQPLPIDGISYSPAISPVGISTPRNVPLADPATN